MKSIRQLTGMTDHDILIQHSEILTNLRGDLIEIKNKLDTIMERKTDNFIFKWIVGGVFVALVFVAGLSLDNRTSIGKNTTSVKVLTAKTDSYKENFMNIIDKH